MKQKTIKTIELVNFLHHLINEKKLLISNQSIVLAVSGGQDSICLFFIFLQLKTQWSWNFSLIYCNHLWQKDSFYTMLHIYKLAYLLDVPIYFTITLQKIFSEQKARNWRSLTFQRITQFYLFSIIVTGHSKSDQIETGLFNIFRGSGTKGVSSLNWRKVVNKRCSFKLNRTQLKTLKNLYQNETNPNILLTHKHSSHPRVNTFTKFQSGMFVKLLTSPKEVSSVTYIVKSHDTAQRCNYTPPGCHVKNENQKRSLRFVSNEIKNKTSIKKDLLRSITLYKNVNNDLLIFDLTPDISKGDVRPCICKKKQISQRYLLRTKKGEKKLSMKKRALGDLRYPNISLTDKNKVFVNPLLILGFVSTIAFGLQTFRLSIKKKRSFKFVKIKQEGATSSAEQNLNIPYSPSCIRREEQISALTSPANISFEDVKMLAGGKEDLLLSTNTRSQVNKNEIFYYGAGAPKQQNLGIWCPLYKTEYTLVRPFLSLSRFDLKKLCTSWKIPLFPDQSNQKVKYQRNRIRKQLLPTLRFFFNPQIDTVLYQFIDIIKNEEEYINFITARIVKKIEQKKERSIELEASLFAVLPIAIRRKVLKYFLTNIMKKSLTFFDVEKLLKQISISKSMKPKKSILKKQDKVNKHISKKFVLNSFNPLTYYKSKVVNTQLTASKKMLENRFVQNLLTLDISDLTSTTYVHKKDQTTSISKGLTNNQTSQTDKNFVFVNLLTSPNETSDVRDVRDLKMLGTCFTLEGGKGDVLVFTNSGRDVIEKFFVKKKSTEKKILRVYFTRQKSYKSKICIIKDDWAKSDHESFTVPFTDKIVEKKTLLSFPLKTKKFSLLVNQQHVSSILQKDILFNLNNKKKSIYKEYKLMFFPKTGSLFLEAQRLFFIKNKPNLFNISHKHS